MRNFAMKELLIVVSRLVAITAAFACVTLSQAPDEHQYGINDLPFEVEKRRLDSVAKVLTSDSDKIVYLVGFNKNGKSTQTACDRLKKSRRYLMKKHRIESQRIVLVYGGSQNGLVMKISIADKNGVTTSGVQDCELQATSI